MKTNPRHTSMKQITSINRLATNKKSTSLGGERREISYGVTTAMKITAKVVAKSHHGVNLHTRGSMIHHGFSRQRRCWCSAMSAMERCLFMWEGMWNGLSLSRCSEARLRKSEEGQDLFPEAELSSARRARLDVEALPSSPSAHGCTRLLVDDIVTRFIFLGVGMYSHDVWQRREFLRH
ncbi:hypothetical protein AB1Y20_011072 [Prymnesium parvum]|uniref:Uncharacterized protein n=1 Tax=Prymnesium parvum TaxID=97485 RepID=A0AB34ILT7_PRYPA